MIKWVANQEIIFRNHICHPAYSERRVNKLKPVGQGQPPPGSVKFYWDTAMAICWHITFACLCATTAKVSSCNRDSIVQRVYNIFYLDLYKKNKSFITSALKREKTTGRSDGKTKDNANKAGVKSRGWWGRGAHRGMLRGRGGGGRCAEGDEQQQRERWEQPGHLRRRSGLRRQQISSFEIISRN